jgi:hypothetical protein
MRVDCGQLDPDAVIRGRNPPKWHPRVPERLDEELARGLARRPQCGVSARRPDGWCAPRGRRRIISGYG